MEKTQEAPQSLILSTRLYRALLAVYPSEFRRAYGDPMLQVFRDCSRRALHKGGNNELFILWIRTLFDTVQTALEEHSQRGVEMSKEKFIKLSGWALMLGGLAVMLGFLASTRPEYNQFNARSLAIDRYANLAEAPLIALGLLLISAGFVGLVLRFGEAAGNFGRYSLGLGAISGLISAAGVIGSVTYPEGEYWFHIWFIGMIFQFLGLALYGLANLRQRSLPRWNGLPVFAGMWIPLFIFVTLLEEENGGWVDWPEWVPLVIFLLTLAGLAGLGYLLQSDSQPAGTAAAAA
jgi:hypothetical protein